MLVYFLNVPTHMAIFRQQFDDSKAKDLDEQALAKLSTGSGGAVTYLIHPAMDYCRDNPDFNLDFMRRTLMVSIASIFDQLPSNRQYGFNKNENFEMNIVY